MTSPAQNTKFAESVPPFQHSILDSTPIQVCHGDEQLAAPPVVPSSLPLKTPAEVNYASLVKGE